MKKYAFLLITVLLATMVLGHGENTLNEGEELIEQKVPCSNLTNEQLAAIGDYYMEQMHPGEQHERMDRMMGGEGSENLQNMHIRMAENMYCGQHEQVSSEEMHDSFQEHHDQGTPWTTILLIVIGIGLLGTIYLLVKKD